ncbi:MAG TPA: Crp/Fnr family transcriptional regulator [bacterium]|nr:Crp/Fnr family transcriptional regulator [bacterium]
MSNRFVANHHLFEDLSPIELAALFAHVQVTTIPKGQPIFHEGSRPTGLFFVIHGKAKVSKRGLWNHEQIVRLAGPGDLLTLRAVGGTPQLVVSATALEDTDVLSIDMDDFFNVIKTNVTFAFKMIELLARELDHAENRIRDLAQMSVRQRLADLLLNLHRIYHDGSEDGSIGVKLSREDLANCVGTATETVVRLLSEFREKRILAVDGRSIFILDRERLERASRPDRLFPIARIDKNQSLS